MSILFIGAHPDDIELGCAGVICYFIEKKQRCCNTITYQQLIVQRSAGTGGRFMRTTSE